MYVYVYMYIYSNLLFIWLSLSFLINIIVFYKPQSNLDLPKLRQDIRERRNATEQIKNLTLAMIRTHAHDLARRCSSHWATVSVYRSWILILISFQISNSFRRFPSLMWTFIDMFWWQYFIRMSTVDSMLNIVEKNCLSFFVIIIVELCIPLSKLVLPIYIYR